LNLLKIKILVAQAIKIKMVWQLLAKANGLERFGDNFSFPWVTCSGICKELVDLL